MRKPFAIIIAFLAAVFVSTFAGASARAKTQLPVDVAVGPTDPTVTIEPDGLVEITVSGSAWTSVTAMRIEARLLDGAELESGELLWSGAAAKGETRSMRFTVKVPSTGTGRIIATVTLLKDGKPVAERRGQYVLDGKQGGQAAKPTLRTGKDSSGRDIIEY